MNFDLTEEQQLLQDSVSRFVQDNYDLASRTALLVVRRIGRRTVLPYRTA